MDEKKYHTLIDELRTTLLHVIFHFQGEPLNNKNLAKLIRYTHNSNIYTSISTNAQQLDSNKARELVQSGLDTLIISIDGATQDIYETYRVGGDLAKAIAGVENVIKWRKILHSSTPFVEIQFIVFRSNEHLLKAMKRLARQLKADRLVFKSAQLYNFECGHELLTTIDKYARYKKDAGGTYSIKNPLPNRCQRLWSGAVVTAGGNVLPCCFDKNGGHIFGNLADGNFSALWHNEQARAFRRAILQDRKQSEICRNCTGK